MRASGANAHRQLEMSPGTLTPDLIRWRRASSVGKPSCRAAVVAADSEPIYRAWVRRAVIAPMWADSAGDLWHAVNPRRAGDLLLPLFGLAVN
jgi:hypothetical protein